MVDSMRLVMAGHVDHGKSTLIGKLLYDTDSLPSSVVKRVEKNCKDAGKEMEYAFLLDALQEEQEQGITIDITKIEFSSKKRHYTIIDAPGHKEFLKNMISGASSAEAAMLLIDAEEGVKEQSKKHAYLLALMGVKQVYVVINKMDLVDYDEEEYTRISDEAREYLRKLGLDPQMFIPTSAKKGDNVTEKSENLSWYGGPTILEAIDMFKKEKHISEKALRFPIQDVYKFDSRRIIAGKIESGTISMGDEIVISPSGKYAKVRSIESWATDDIESVEAGYSTGITVDEEYYFKRGEVISKRDSKPHVSDMIRASIFWMGNEDLVEGKNYKLKLATQEVTCRVRSLNKAVDSDTLEVMKGKKSLSCNDVGEVILKLKEPIAFDPFEDIMTMGRFVVVDGTVVSGGGIIERPTDELRERTHVDTSSDLVTPRKGLVSYDERTNRLGQKGKVIWITGLSGSGKDDIAVKLERRLFDQGKFPYHIDAGNVRFGLSSDLDFSDTSRHEHTRRIAELANVMMNSGLIVIVSVISPFRKDREYARDIMGEDNFVELFVDASLDFCKKNDPHGLYSRSEKGEIQNVPGVDIPYERASGLNHVINVGEDMDIDLIVSDILRLI